MTTQPQQQQPQQQQQQQPQQHCVRGSFGTCRSCVVRSQHSLFKILLIARVFYPNSNNLLAQNALFIIYTSGKTAAAAGAAAVATVAAAAAAAAAAARLSGCTRTEKYCGEVLCSKQRLLIMSEACSYFYTSWYIPSTRQQCAPTYPSISTRR